MCWILGDGRYQVEHYAMVAGVYSMSATVGSAGLHRDFGEFDVQQVVFSISPTSLFTKFDRIGLR